MIDIIEKLREYAQYAETRSERDTFEATINEITGLREDLASAKQAAAAYEAWKFPEDIQALTVENERLLEENARVRELLDDVWAQWDGDWPEELVKRVKAAISGERATGGP